MTAGFPQVLVVRLPSTATRSVSWAFPQPTTVAWPAESLAYTRFCVADPELRPVRAEVEATTTGAVQLVPCRTSETIFPPEIETTPRSPTASAASCPKCCLLSGPNNAPESTHCPPGARLETCRTQ